MTVSSTISVFCRDGVFRTVYCHLHGEPTWNGRILHTHYATGQQAEALVEHGDIRCLGPRCDKPAGHTLQNPVDGVTAYYGRDSGFRMDSEAREYRSFREAAGCSACGAAGPAFRSEGSVWLYAGNRCDIP
ncbi:Uncharacterised protein [Shigella sonnei]|nr:Uncharacterised protein [Shigella sonnei]CSX47154.1 Uncharacterised protein [Shigella sonnei]SIY97618.1 Uncharacterised protein [Shigella sonnei]